MRIKLSECLAYHFLGSQWDLFWNDVFGFDNWTRISIHGKGEQMKAVIVEGRFKSKSVINEVAKKIQDTKNAAK